VIREKSKTLGKDESLSYYQRNLPHWLPEGRAIFVTWRLYGSLPRGFVRQLKAIRRGPGAEFLAADREMDSAATGPRWLHDPKVAKCVTSAIRQGADRGYFGLHAYVVMPNHVHMLIEPRVPLRRITNGIKGASAREANRILGRIGKAFWQDESFDHWIRSEAQFEKVRAYIQQNPVKAGLVVKADLWSWSSAHR
jgi:putative transposase